MSVNGQLAAAATVASPPANDAVPAPTVIPNGVADPPPSLPTNAVLELADGSKYDGVSFGATGKSIAGECVFQTGKLHFGLT